MTVKHGESVEKYSVIESGVRYTLINKPFTVHGEQRRRKKHFEYFKRLATVAGASVTQSPTESKTVVDFPKKNRRKPPMSRSVYVFSYRMASNFTGWRIRPFTEPQKTAVYLYWNPLRRSYNNTGDLDYSFRNLSRSMYSQQHCKYYYCTTVCVQTPRLCLHRQKKIYTRDEPKQL